MFKKNISSRVKKPNNNKGRYFWLVCRLLNILGLYLELFCYLDLAYKSTMTRQMAMKSAALRVCGILNGDFLCSGEE